MENRVFAPQRVVKRGNAVEFQYRPRLKPYYALVLKASESKGWDYVKILADFYRTNGLLDALRLDWHVFRERIGYSVFQ